MRHQEYKVLTRPHWLPIDDEVEHTLSEDCWCDPLDFGEYVAHRRAYRHVTQTYFPLTWNDARNKMSKK